MEDVIYDTIQWITLLVCLGSLQRQAKAMRHLVKAVEHLRDAATYMNKSIAKASNTIRIQQIQIKNLSQQVEQTRGPHEKRNIPCNGDG